MRRRAAEAKKYQVTKLEDLRECDPQGQWPRIVAVIDEFQYLFAERDAVSKTAQALLEDIARRGRSQGIHLVLASQDVSGIEAFWGRAAIFEQFVLRIALPRARRVLDKTNDAPLELPRWHAVVNHESGVKHGNLVVRVPNASAPGLMREEVQHRLPADWYDGFAEPRTFDGSRAPRRRRAAGAASAKATGAPPSARRSTWTRAPRSSSCPMRPAATSPCSARSRAPPSACSPPPPPGCSRASRRSPSRSCWRCWSRRRSTPRSGCATGSSTTTSAWSRAPRSRPRSRSSGRRSPSA